MSALDVHAALKQGMGPALHWFPADVAISRLSAVLVGMANTCGGTVLLGVAPRSPQILGIPDPALTLDNVFQAALLADPPLVLPMPQIVPSEKGQVMVLVVPAGLPNIYNLEGRYLGREGSQTNPLPARKLRQLLMERGVLHFELQIPPYSTMDDLDSVKIADYLSIINLPGNEPPELALLRRGCLRYEHPLDDARVRLDSNGSSIKTKDLLALRPTYAALLLFGKYPQQWLPGATILAARFSGLSPTDIFIKQDIGGTLPDQIRQAEGFLRDQMRSVVHIVGLTHERMLEYPLEAVRELLVNSVAHRDYNLQGDTIHIQLYQDRLEIHSPGGLPGPVTLKNLLEARFSRNAVVMQVLADMGFVERLGYGLNRVVDVMRRSDLRSPLFDEVGGTFRVTLFAAEEEIPEEHTIRTLRTFHDLAINQRQEYALNYILHHRRITNREYQDLCPDVHAETLRRDLADLVTSGVLVKIGDKRATYYVLKHL